MLLILFQVVQQELSKDGALESIHGPGSLPVEVLDASKQDDSDNNTHLIDAVNAALCMRELSQGLQECTAVMVGEGSGVCTFLSS